MIDIKNASDLWDNYTLTPVKYSSDDLYYNEIYNNSYKFIWIKPREETCFIFTSFSALDNSTYDNGLFLKIILLIH